MGRKAKEYFYQSKGKCPYCSKSIVISVKKIITQKPVKGEFDLRQIIEKDSQKTLSEQNK